MIEIIPVDTPKQLAQFVDFPHDLYAGDPNYVPELFIAQRDLLTPSHHPFFKHSKAKYFLAKKDGKVAGRIAAIRNNNHIEYTKTKEGFFGFFDVVNDYEVAKKLFDTACEWVKKEGLTAIVGPANPSSNETMGMLIEGFQYPPSVMMTYNKNYYSEFAEKYGFKKKMDTLSYLLRTDNLPTRVISIAERLEERLKSKGIIIRKVKMKKFKEEVEQIMKIYNSAWEHNWGFVPMTDDEFRYTAKDMKMILDPDLALIAEMNGKAIGFSLAIPDINFALKKIKRGRLLPTGIFKLLYYKGKVKHYRVITLGVLQEYRKLGIDAVFYAKSLLIAKGKGVKTGEGSWVLESNMLMRKAMEDINGVIDKKWRVYSLSLN